VKAAAVFALWTMLCALVFYQVGFGVSAYWFKAGGTWSCSPIRWVELELEARSVEMQCFPPR
jgi:hypothetical protein